METVTLGFKAYDVHELACHFVARHAGLYSQHGLRVRLIDTTFVADDDLPPRTLHAACGAALTAWLHGADVRVVFVATDRPMFWLYADRELRDMGRLEGNAVAGFPAYAPPALFLRAILRRHSIDPELITTVPARDDTARIGLLCDGSVSAAVLSSAVAPRVLDDAGLHELSFFGAEIRIPTTGLAADRQTLEGDADLVVAMSRCYRHALELIHGEAGVLEAALAESVPGTMADLAALADLVRGCYTRTGRSSPETLAAAVSMLAGETNATNVRPVETLYDFSALDGASA